MNKTFRQVSCSKTSGRCLSDGDILKKFTQAELRGFVGLNNLKFVCVE